MFSLGCVEVPLFEGLEFVRADSNRDYHTIPGLPVDGSVRLAYVKPHPYNMGQLMDSSQLFSHGLKLVALVAFSEPDTGETAGQLRSLPSKPPRPDTGGHVLELPPGWVFLT